MPYYPGAGQTWSNQFRKNYQPGYPPVQTFLISNTFDATPVGTNASSANTGGLNGTAFPNVISGSNAFITFDNTYVAHGISAIKMQTTSVASTCSLRWLSPTSFITSPTIWYRVYYLAQAWPSANVRVFHTAGGNANTTLCSSVNILTTGALRLLNSGGGTIATTTNLINPGQWYRLEGFVYGSSTAGVVQLQVFNNIESTVPLETIGATGVNTADYISSFTIGTTPATANWGPFWYDSPAISNIGPIGPEPFPEFIPQFTAMPGNTWQKNYQHKQLTYPSIFDMYVGPALGTVNVAVNPDNTLVVSQSIAPPNVSVSGQADNLITEVISGTVSSVNVSGQSDNIVTELLTGQTSNVNSAAASGSLLINVIGSISSVNSAAQSGVINETILGSVSSVTVSGISGSVLESVSGSTGNVSVSAIAGIAGQLNANIVGSPASVVVMAPSGTIFKEPDGTWWRVYPAYRSYPT